MAVVMLPPRDWHGRLGKARRSKVLQAWLCKARHDAARTGRSGTVRLVRKGRLGVVGLVQGTARQARQGEAEHGIARQRRQGKGREAWPDAAGEAWRCQASSGVAGEAAMDGPGSDWQAWRGPVWLRVVLQARCGEARCDRGTAWQAWPERQRLAMRGRRGVDRWAPMGLVTQGRHGSVGRDRRRRTGKARRELVRRGVAGVAWLDGARHRKAQPARMLLPKCSTMGA